MKLSSVEKRSRTAPAMISGSGLALLRPSTRRKHEERAAANPLCFRTLNSHAGAGFGKPGAVPGAVLGAVQAQVQETQRGLSASPGFAGPTRSSGTGRAMRSDNPDASSAAAPAMKKASR